MNMGFEDGGGSVARETYKLQVPFSVFIIGINVDNDIINSLVSQRCHWYYYEQ